MDTFLGWEDIVDVINASENKEANFQSLSLYLSEIQQFYSATQHQAQTRKVSGVRPYTMSLNALTPTLTICTNDSTQMH